jgi:hypothetical protein
MAILLNNGIGSDPMLQPDQIKKKKKKKIVHPGPA